MFLTKNFCYLELHRTGSIHISQILKKIFLDGKQIGFHNRAKEELYNSNFFFLGSVRNPWDWYVSMWSKACQKQGIHYMRTAGKRFFFTNIGLKTKPLLAPFIFFDQINKPLKLWREVYSDPKNKKNFKTWLNLILKDRIYDDGSGYAFSSIKNFSGQLTYRYLALYTNESNKLFDDSIKNFEEMKSFDNKKNVLKFIIKKEELEKNLITFIGLKNINLSEDKRKFIESEPKSNTSERLFNYKDYYDPDSAELVSQKEKLIIEKYNYKF